MEDLHRIAKNIKKKDNGIYYSVMNSDISYPEDGNSNCFQIEKDSFWFNHRNDVILEAVKKYSPKKFFFDIGGGNGFVAKGLQESGVKVVLVEPGHQGALNAKRRNIKKVVCATLEDAQFNKSSIESMGMFDVVEHIQDDIGFLKDAHSYLEKGGYIYITVPAYKFLWSKEDDFAGHYRRYSLSQLETLVNKCGFDVVYSTYIFSILPLPVFLSRTIPTKLGLAKKSSDINKNKREHNNNKGFFNSILNRIWRWELQNIKKAKKIPFGGSSFVVAKK